MCMVMSKLMLWIIWSDSIKDGLTGIFQEYNLMKDQKWLKYCLNYLVMNQILCLCPTIRVCLMPTRISVIVAWIRMKNTETQESLEWINDF